MKELSPKQTAFVREYLMDLNAAQAAIRAGYSRKRAGDQGRRLLNSPEIREAVAAAQAERAERTGVSADRVVEELAKIAFSDLRDVMVWGPDGVSLKDSTTLTEAQAALVAEVVEGSGKTLRIKRHDKVKALELLGRHIGMFREKVETELSGDVALTWQK